MTPAKLDAKRMAEETLELLRCPFCGDAPITERIEPHSHTIATFMPAYPGAWIVECAHCEFRIFDHDSEANARAKWNRRSLAEQPKAEAVAKVTYSNWNGMKVEILHTSSAIFPVGTILYASPIAAPEPVFVRMPKERHALIVEGRKWQERAETAERRNEAWQIQWDASQRRVAELEAREIGRAGKLALLQDRLATVEAILHRWLDHYTEEAGMTPEIAIDHERFMTFMESIDKKQDLLIADTKDALAPAVEREQP